MTASGSGGRHRSVGGRPLTSIQALRGIAALFVVAFHATVLWHDRAGDRAFVWQNGNAGVDLFFVISGFVIMLSASAQCGARDQWRRFAAQRAIRLVPMYWLATSCKLLSVAVASGLAIHSHPTPWNVIASYLFIPAFDGAGAIVPVLAVGWTLTFEVAFYAAFTAALYAGRDPLRVAAPVLGLLALASVARTQAWPAAGAIANPIVLEFLLGAVIGRAYLRNRLPREGGLWILLFGVAGVVVLSLVAVSTVWDRTFMWGGAAGAVVAAALVFERQLSRCLPRLLAGLGEASYSLYLIHGFVLPVVGISLRRLDDRTWWFGPLLILLGLAASALAALAVHTCIERPLTRWLKRAAVPQSVSHVMAASNA